MKLLSAIISIVILFSQNCLAYIDISDLQPYTGRTITKIDIVRKNIFDDKIASDHGSPFYYRWANSLHIMTRQSVIERELLFKVGNKLDLERIIETERNLRLGGFIGEVNIEAASDGADGVDLKVVTTDLWTTKVSVFADLAGGKYATGIDLVEQNLFGYGKTIDILGQVGNDQKGYNLLYLDNRLIGSRLALGLMATDFTYDRGFSISLGHPQYSLSVHTSYKAIFSQFDTRPRLFYKGNEYFRYKNKNTLSNFEGAYIFGNYTRLGVIVGYDYEKYNYSPNDPNSTFNYLIPPNEVISYPLIGLSGSVIQYDVERYLDGPGLPEDLTLGASLKATIGRSAKIFGATYRGYFPKMTAQFLFKPGSRTFIGGIESISWWHRNGRNERIRHISEAAFYYKPYYNHVLVLHALTDFAWRQKSTYQVFLGGGNGLRGHSYYEFSGTKSALANIEYRFYLPIEILTVKLGAAAFFDIGNVWRSDQHIKLGDLKSDVGVGLRFGLTRSSTSRVVNLDIARALSHYGVFVVFSSSTSMLRLSDINVIQ